MSERCDKRAECSGRQSALGTVYSKVSSTLPGVETITSASSQVTKRASGRSLSR